MKRKWFTGYWGQLRLSAVLPWKWDRQGQHAIVGFVVTLAAFLGAMVVPPILVGLVYLGLVVTFIAYEWTENDDIRDFAWPDLFGWMLGVGAALPFGVAAWWFLPDIANRYGETLRFVP